jgi:hypothetical protein
VRQREVREGESVEMLRPAQVGRQGLVDRRPMRRVACTEEVSRCATTRGTGSLTVPDQSWPLPTSKRTVSPALCKPRKESIEVSKLTRESPGGSRRQPSPSDRTETTRKHKRVSPDRFIFLEGGTPEPTFIFLLCVPKTNKVIMQLQLRSKARQRSRRSHIPYTPHKKALASTS